MSANIIKHLIIYPIKSMGPIFKDEIEVGPNGLQGDREMMLIDATGKFITQRTKRELVRFQLKEYQDSYKVIDRWGNEEVKIDMNGFNQLVEKVEIWDDTVQQVWMNNEMSTWFSTILKEPVRLVKLNDNYQRQISEKHVTTYSKSTSFADSLPILLCTTASLQFVEDEYGAFDFLRFRPNIVIKNSIPFEEDKWLSLQSNHVRLSNKKPCARCNLIAVDPQSSEVDLFFLKKLSEFRTVNHNVLFGVQLVPETGGRLMVGEEVAVVQQNEVV